MSLSSTTTKVSYSDDDSTTSFAVSFKFLANADVKAILRDSAGTETTWTEGTQYTLTGAGLAAGGTLTVETSPTDYTPATGETLVIKRAAAETQSTSLHGGGPLPSDSVEEMADRNVMLVQAHSEELSRALRFSETSPDSGVNFPDVTDNGEKLFRVNSAGTGIELVTLASIDSSSVTTPVSLANGGTAADLSSPTAEDIIRINAAGTAMEGRSPRETVADLFEKGADIASASPLVIGTDGSYFDVTGTTGFSAMTVAAGRLFMLQFDGALTMTDGASLDLAGADITTAAGTRCIFYATAANTVQLLGYVRERGINVEDVVQSVRTVSTALVSGTTTIPLDDSIPQLSSEGTLMLSRSITPTNANNLLRIDAQLTVSTSAAVTVILALFQDSTEDAIAVVPELQTSTNALMRIGLRHEMTAGTTSSTTFKIHAGGSGASTIAMNGVSAARVFGGVCVSDIIVTEILV